MLAAGPARSSLVSSRTRTLLGCWNRRVRRDHLEGARRRRSHAAITYELGDALNLSYPSGSFDACVSTLAIDVVPEPKKFKPPRCDALPAQVGSLHAAPLDFWGGFSEPLNTSLKIAATLDEDMWVILRLSSRSAAVLAQRGMAHPVEELDSIDSSATVPIAGDSGASG